MREISSSDNRILKQAASLREKKYRDALGLYLIEGPNFIRDAMNCGGGIKSLFVRAGIESRELKNICLMAEDRGIPVYELSGSAYEKLSDTDSSQGIAAVAEKKLWTEDDLFKDPDSDILVLDRIQDPGNLGTMLRTAEAMGFSGVMLIRGCADIYGPKLVRAAAGSLFRLPVLYADSSRAAAAMLEAHEKKLYAAVMDGGVPCFKAELSRGIAVIIGNEGNGVCPFLLERAEGLTIPMAGNIESLNAGLAAGIIMYEAFRQKSLEILRN